MWYDQLLAPEVRHQPSQVRPSGPYVFRPSGPAKPWQVFQGEGDKQKPMDPIHVSVGPLLGEVTMWLAPEAALTIRIYAGARTWEVEWTVGPLPDARDVILRLDTSLDTGDVFWTDSNGREMVRRQRGVRPSWAMQDPGNSPPLANPLGRDYFPITSIGYVEDKGRDLRMGIVSDRSHGFSSTASGSFEVMLHRRMARSDELGNAEILTDVEGSGEQQQIARGVLKVWMEARGSTGGIMRKLQQGTLSPLIQLYGLVPTPPRPRQGTIPVWGELDWPILPANVHVITLEALPGDMLLLRLSHNAEAGEDGTEATSLASVNISALLHPVSIVSVEEMTLTGNAPRGKGPRLSWNAGEPIYGVPQGLREPPDGNSSNPRIQGPDGMLYTLEGLARGVQGVAAGFERQREAYREQKQPVLSWKRSRLKGPAVTSDPVVGLGSLDIRSFLVTVTS